jgi:asparagine synthase (glutamine-hydrolysing)
MSAFAVLYSTTGRDITDAECRRYTPAPRRDRICAGPWIRWGACAAMVADSPLGGPVACSVSDNMAAVGVLRLDDFPGTSTAAESECSSDTLRSLACLCEQQSAAPLCQLSGEFGIVIYDRRHHTLTAARDIVGIQPLYWAQDGELLIVTSVQMWLDDGRPIDERYIGHFLINGGVSPEVSLFKGVTPVPAGATLEQRGGRRIIGRYWDVRQIERHAHLDPDAAVEEFRHLLFQAVRSRLRAQQPVWSQLSGGMDSSSIVSIAATLTASETNRLPGLAGTVTLVDTLGSGDERPFAQTVIEKHGVANYTIVDYWPWQADDRPAPMTDGPGVGCISYAANRRMTDIIVDHGGTILLSGYGADQYLLGSLMYFADLAIRGQVVNLATESLRWARYHRLSIYRLLMRNVLRPMLPWAIRQHLKGQKPYIPSWVAPEIVALRPLREWTLHTRNVVRHSDHFSARIATEIESLAGTAGVVTDDGRVQVRFPFLDRRLLEFGLRLPPALLIQPRGQKWILAQAMRGILPERVRTRTSKGGGAVSRFRWTLTRERERVRALLDDPVLARLGFVDARQLRVKVARAERGAKRRLDGIINTLALETWFRIKEGSWS